MSGPGPVWDRLGLEPTDDARAIKRAYSRKLKAIDVEADPAAFIALRQDRDLALALAARGQVAPIAAPPRIETPPDPSPEPEPRAELEPEPDAPRTLVRLRPAVEPPDPELQPEPEADGRSPPVRLRPAARLPEPPPPDPLPPPAPVDARPLPRAMLHAPAPAEADRADLNRIAALLNGSEPAAAIAPELEVLSRRVLDQLAQATLTHAVEVEAWLADMIARAPARSDVMLAPVIAFFRWDQRGGDWRAHPAVRAVLQRQEDRDFRTQLESRRTIDGRRHSLARAFRELKRPPPKGFRFIGESLRGEMYRLLAVIRADHPTLVNDVDPAALKWWTDKIMLRSRVGQAWAKVAAALPGGAKVWDPPVRRRLSLVGLALLFVFPYRALYLLRSGYSARIRLIGLGWMVLVALSIGLAGALKPPNAARSNAVGFPTPDTQASDRFFAHCAWRSPMLGAPMVMMCPDAQGRPTPVALPEGFGSDTFSEADSGQPAAMDAVGRLYAEGPEPVRDRRAAAMWFRKAADAGDGDAMYRLGVLNAAPGGIYGDGANRAEAVRWYREAAAVGVPAGQYALGLEYFRGQALPKDDVAAFGLLKQAADKGYVPALAPLGLMYETGAGGAPRDAALALSLYRSAAEKNDPIGMVQLARRDWTGVGVARSPGETVRLLRQAATLGNPSAMVFLAQLELQGGVAKNDADALALFRKAAKQGDPVAMYDLGVMYRDGLGVGRDRAAALDNFERAADAGYTPAGKAEGALLAQQAKSGRR